jgi:hypothetical protein
MADTPQHHWLETLRYRVEVLRDENSLEEVVGKIGDRRVAEATYQAAIARYPSKLIMLYDGQRILRRND